MDNKKLKILCLEDIEEDAIIIKELLKREGLIFQFDHVSTEKELTNKLESEKYDIVLSDYNLPGFSGIAAMLISKKICPEVPFICVSGTIGEDLAVELMQFGASDYILKDNLNKLPVAIQRALSQAKEYKARIEAEISLRQSEARFRDILMSSYDWIWEIDREWKYSYSSHTVEKILGYPPNKVIGRSPFDFMPPEEQKNVGSIFLECIKSKGIIKDMENWNIHKDGHPVCLLTNGFPILDEAGALIGYRGVDKDITKSKNLNLELIKAKEKAEAGDRLKTAFMNNISHEIRTPLNGILGFSEFIVQPGLQQEEKELYLKILNESSDRLLNTITNYMDISLIVSGNIVAISKLVDLSFLIDKIYEKFHPKTIAKNLEFIKQLPSDIKTPLKCDEGLLDKAISHLLDNAIKFTMKGSITIGYNFTNSVFEVFVKDTGPGIDPQSQSSIFHIFMQEDIDDTRGYEGSGLGLSIANGLVELMGGKIRLESEKSIGSSFYITLLQENGALSETESTYKIRNNIKDSGSKLILIAEDDESNSAYLGMLLGKNSFDYLMASNGKEAIEKCRSHPEISLVLMDLKMPVLNGLEATRKIKEFRKNLPIIGLTAYAMTGDKEKALEAGCDEYLTKPVNSGLLISMIKKLS